MGSTLKLIAVYRFIASFLWRTGGYRTVVLVLPDVQLTKRDIDGEYVFENVTPMQAGFHAESVTDLTGLHLSFYMLDFSNGRTYAPTIIRAPTHL